jgi:dTDP-4-dehydrorhamnose reductase
MKYFILGCNGMAGHMLGMYLLEQGHKVTGFARSESKVIPTVIGDANNLNFLAEAIRSSKCDVIVNAIGILNKNADDNKAKAVFLNSFLPHHLVDITADASIRVFHLSTDCVFAGNTGPYFENSVPDGTTFYDRSKALGEFRDDKNLTFRQSIVGPEVKQGGIGLLDWFMQQEGRVCGYKNVIWTGLTTLELAKTVERAAEMGTKGLIQTVPKGPGVSKFELLSLFNKYLRDGVIQIDPAEEPVSDKTLVQSDNDLCREIVPYEQQIEELSIWMRQHEDLYPAYYWAR